MNLQQAQGYAEAIAGWLRPYCWRIEIAGSIRRRRPVCNDVDIVCIPKLEERQDLLGNLLEVRNLLLEFLISYVSAVSPKAAWRSGTEPKADAVNLLVTLPKCELDLWCANEANFATRLLCRTGSREHNIWLASRAIDRGFHWAPYHGLKRGGHTVQAREEADIYRALDLDYIAPEMRDLAALKALDEGERRRVAALGREAA